MRILAALSLLMAAPVETRVEPVEETLHGVKIVDPYRWLEKADEGEVEEWTEKQNAHMRKVLDAVPGRKWIEERLWQLHEIGTLGVPVVKSTGKFKAAKTSAKTADKTTPKRYFYTKRTGKQNQPVLYVRDGLDGPDKPLVDVNKLAADGTRALDWWFPSEDGKLVAYGVSESGDEESVLRVRDVATGKDRPLEITRTRACSVAWLPDGKGFYYTRYPLPGSVPPAEEKYHRHVYFHRLGGDPARDIKMFGPGRDLKDWPSVKLSPNGRWLTIEVSQGWAKSEVFLVDTHIKAKRGPDSAAPNTPVITGKAALYNVADVLDDRFYLVANEDAPRYRVFSVDPKNPGRASWKEIIPQGEDTLDNVSFVGGRLAALYLKDASSRVRLFETDGKPLGEIALPTLGTVSALSGEHQGEELFFGFVSFLNPTQIFRHDFSKGAEHVWQKLPNPFAAAGFEISQQRYKSKDGTSVPMFLVHRKGLKKDGNNPTLLYGYGGFNISLTPAFAAQLGPFIEKGGVYAVANLRGGAEYGEAWHQAGMLGRKQNVFDDFIAAAEHLIAQKITSPAKLAISGRSNGGLLTSAALTQRPDLFRAVISGVPLTDMLRYHHFRIAKLWIPEYGSAEDPAAFKWLHAYSPYHRVKDKVGYPAVLLFTAESDTRVDAMHARKMAARLQAATTGKRPILLRLEGKAGHGAGKPLSKQIAQFTDELSFLFSELGMSANPS